MEIKSLYTPLERLHANGRANNFNLIRILAATCVILSHAYPLSLGMGASEPLSTFLPNYNLGRLAVWTFFIISGFFISQSFECRQGRVDFFAARILRIYPGLLVALFCTAFIIGPVFSHFPLHDYFGSWAPVGYVFTSLSLKRIVYELPGVFTQNPYPDRVNGPLWTLYYEVLCYLLVVCVGMIATRRPVFFICFSHSIFPYICI